MANGWRMNRYSRRTSSGGGRSRVALIIVSVAVFVVLCLIISIIVGISLGKRAEEHGLSDKYDLSVEEYYSGNKKIGAVDAYVFSAESNLNSYIVKGVNDFSVCLSDSEGGLVFHSDVSPELSSGESEDGKPKLDELANRIHSYKGRICAYVYVKTFEIEDGYLRELRKAYEIALVNEAVRLGVDEIMLVGLQIDDESIDELEAYVSKMSFAAEKAALGVLIAPRVFKLAEEEVYHASRIRSVCDFVALDLRSLSSEENEGEENELEAILREMEYYVSAYDMRLVFAKSNSTLYDKARELGAKSIQIIEE